MNSLEIIKQELINQKKLLDEKGFTVTTTYTNPSPTEITNAIEKINFDFTNTTATEEDVRLGKTFYSQTNELKTGTFDLQIVDALNQKVDSLIGGIGSMEIEIPNNITRIRNGTYAVDEFNAELFYKHNLTIPEGITRIGERGFYNCQKLTGLLTIPSTCTFIGKEGFSKTNIEEVVINGSLASNSSYTFLYCFNLKKVTINGAITTFPTFIFRSCSTLEEIIFPTSLGNLKYNDISLINTLKLLKFRASTPCTVDAECFSKCSTATILVPYESFDSYYNATNFLAHGNPMYGFGNFEKGYTLPSETAGYTIVWYPTLEDLQANTNPITECPETGTMYASFTEIAS